MGRLAFERGWGAAVCEKLGEWVLVPVECRTGSAERLGRSASQWLFKSQDQAPNDTQGHRKGYKERAVADVIGYGQKVPGGVGETGIIRRIGT